ncbi:MAG: glycosyltransferase family 2 protein [Paludibacter sp.]|nr:glycosyltransferase family 2 protein [Paludibacter sp.]
MLINVSVVLYNSPVHEVEQLVATLRASVVVNNIYLIDNSPTATAHFETLNAHYLFNNKNIGYGAAHNIALRKSITQDADYHLVVNSDIQFKPAILEQIVLFMNLNTDIGHLMPKVFYPSGEIQYLCKLIPTPFDLIFRRFVPKQWTKKQQERFELRHTGYNRVMDVPYLSGCFMLLRVCSLKEVELFDERFFMYPEDIDLTRRMHEKYRTVFYPEVSVIHAHAQSSYKSKRMLWIHIRNLIKYFNKWGWIYDKKRMEVNRKILKNTN